MYKLTLFAAAGAFLLTGCDFSSSGADLTTDAGIASVEISSLSQTFRGEAWDADGAPDVFIELRNAAGRAFYRSEVIADADISETIAFEVDEALVGSPTIPLFIAVFDMDDSLVHSQEMATSAAFTVEDMAAGALQLEGTGRGANARFEIRASADQDDV